VTPRRALVCPPNEHVIDAGGFVVVEQARDDQRSYASLWKLIDWLHEELRELADAAGVEL
jgi:hypothetical protein